MPPGSSSHDNWLLKPVLFLFGAQCFINYILLDFLSSPVIEHIFLSSVLKTKKKCFVCVNGAGIPWVQLLSLVLSCPVLTVGWALSLKVTGSTCDASGSEEATLHPLSTGALVAGPKCY